MSGLTKDECERLKTAWSRSELRNVSCSFHMIDNDLYAIDLVIKAPQALSLDELQEQYANASDRLQVVAENVIGRTLTVNEMNLRRVVAPASKSNTNWTERASTTNSGASLSF